MLLIAAFIIAIITGILTTLVIRRTTDARALRDTRKRIHAHLLEFRLFFDEPRLIWRAQIALLRDNARLFLLLLPTALILAFPMTWLVLQLDAVYGLRPLRLGEPAIVTAQLKRPIQATDRFDLRASGITIETPPVRTFHDNQVNWRIRRASNGYSALDLTVNGQVIRKTVSGMILSPRRSRSFVDFLLHPEEPRLPEGDLAWVEIAFPEANNTWMLWFLFASTVAAVSTGVATVRPVSRGFS